MKKIPKLLLVLILLVVLVCCGLFAFLTITEYKPEEIEIIEVEGNAGSEISAGDEITLLTYNIGHGGLSADMDTYADGGEMSSTPTASLIERNLECMTKVMKNQDCDIYILQDVDKKAQRSHNIDTAAYIKATVNGVSAFANDYLCKFVPMPITGPIGPVDSGILTISDFAVGEAARQSLPTGGKWPFRTFEPKRCMLVQRITIGNSGDQQLVVVNVHFEDSDDGDTKIEQSRFLATFANEEYSKGNFVIIGGSFNQTFPGADPALYPIRNTANFIPGVLESSLFGPGWNFAFDESTPTARLANAPYNEYDPYTQFYVIDGFVVSPNVTVKGVHTVDTDFKYSSHQPVKLRVVLGVVEEIPEEPLETELPQ